MYVRLIVAMLFVQALSKTHHRRCWCPDSTKCQQEPDSFLTIKYKCSELDNATEVYVSEINNTSKIFCNNTLLDCGKLPQLSLSTERTLKHLTVDSCNVRSLKCALSALGASGVLTLEYLVSTPITADILTGLEMLGTLYLVGPSSTPFEIPTEAISSLPNLTMLRLIKLRLNRLPSHAFKNSASKMTNLEVTSANITVIEANAFKGLTELITLEMYKNPVEEIDANVFKGLSSLSILSISECNLSVIHTGLFSEIPLLENITLIKNKKQLHLKPGAIKGLNHLKKLILQSNGLILEPASLSNLSSLSNVIIRESGMTSLPGNIFVETPAVMNLNLSGNELSNLPSTVFNGLTKLLRLDLSYNKLESVDKAVFEPLLQLRELNLQGNLIQVLRDNTFSSLHKLSEISLSNNRLREIEEDVFYVSITSLDLSNNLLTWCPSRPGKPVSKYPSPLRELKALQNLILRNNSISDVCTDWIEQMAELKYLDLSFNNITLITGVDINFISHNVIINVEDNNITTLKELTNEDSPKALHLSRNPINCDCELYDFLHLLKNSSYYVRYEIDNLTCQAPNSLKGCSLKTLVDGGECGGISVSLSNLTCPIDSISGCQCQIRPFKNITECECDKLENNTLLYNNKTTHEMLLKLRSPPYSNIPSYVTMLDLSGTYLNSVPDLPTNLSYVNLSSNNLRRISLEFLQRNLTVDLANNPFECECSDVEDVKNLQKYQHKINDYILLRCKDKSFISSANPLGLCYRIYTYYAVVLALFCFILACTIPLCYKYKLHIRVWLSGKGFSCLTVDKMDIEDMKKTYDIFLSFVHQDAKFVKEHLLPKLRKKYKVCIHTEDWIIGDSILDQIYRSVADSRRTLIVLSNAYIHSGFWAQEEFRAAYLQTAIDKRQRCVVVLLDDVDIENASQEIKMHVKLNTYIEWGDRLFWERLYDAVPRKLKVSHLKRRMLTERAIRILGRNHFREEVALMNIKLPEAGDKALD